MLTNLQAPSFLRRLLLPAAVLGALAFGSVAGERTASAQEFGVEVVPASPGYGYTWAPGYWGYRPGYGRTWYGGRSSYPGHAGWGGAHHGGGWGGARGGWGHGGGHAGGHAGGGHAGGHGHR